MSCPPPSLSSHMYSKYPRDCSIKYCTIRYTENSSIKKVGLKYKASRDSVPNKRKSVTCRSLTSTKKEPSCSLFDVRFHTLFHTCRMEVVMVVVVVVLRSTVGLSE